MTHKERGAHIYLRQSTMFQVMHHQESTDRQYSLRDKALSYGWTEDKIKMLDGDLGQSGTQTQKRHDFNSLVADVSMGKVGAIFVLEASRLSRCSSDWNRLLELCALTHTLIIDEDGIYNPSLFNDQLLLGLKGTMSQAELHMMRIRLYGGKVSKAKKGLLRFTLPIGYCYLDDEIIDFDQNTQVKFTIDLLFSTFCRLKSAYGVVQYFTRNKIDVPKKSHKGKPVWGKLTHGRVLAVLKNPFYAGMYTFGRYKSRKIIDDEGKIKTVLRKMPMEQWEVTIKDHHPAYISWDDYEKNLLILESNRTNLLPEASPSPVREGSMLLQGLLICGKCGRRVTIRYQGNGGKYATYECTRAKRDGLSEHTCISMRSDHVDIKIEERIIEVLTPEKINIALNAIGEIEKRNTATDKHWEIKIQRAEYEVSLAERRYEQVDPANRLVALNLEKKWEVALNNHESIKKQYQEYLQKKPSAITEDRKNELMILAKDIPRLWQNSKDMKTKKRIVRLLVKDITVTKEINTDSLSSEWVLQIRWKGGLYETLRILPPSRIYDKLRYSDQMVERVKVLAKSGYHDLEIAQSLNAQNYKSATGKDFTKSMISWIRFKHNIELKISGPLKNEYSVKKLMTKFNVSGHVVRYWIKKAYVKHRKLYNNKLLIFVDADTEKKLWERIKASSKLKSHKMPSSMNQ